MGGAVQEVDFKSPKTGSKYAIIINEGCTAGLFGMVNVNRYECEVERAAFDYGYRIGIGSTREM